MKKPVPEDFDLTDQEYTILVAELSKINEAVNKLPSQGLRALTSELMLGLVMVWYIGLLTFVVGAIIGLLLEKVIGFRFSMVFGIIGASLGVSYIIIIGFKDLYSANKKRLQYREQMSNPKFQKVSRYDEAISRYEKTQNTYWKSLRGIKLEKVISELYKKMGYSVQITKASGDEGIDLILSKKDETIVIQCKGHEKPIGVGVVRDLYGSMMHFGTNRAILVCPAGFTKGVLQFMKNKPIQLISADDLVKMSDGI
jgi:hypothetical protein